MRIVRHDGGERIWEGFEGGCVVSLCLELYIIEEVDEIVAQRLVNCLTVDLKVEEAMRPDVV